MSIYSATRPVLSKEQPIFYIKQMIWAGIGLIVLLLLLIFDYIWLKRFAYFFYFFIILLLILVLVIGKTSMGARRWLHIGSIAFQPSEILRVILIIALSRWLSSFKGVITRLSFLPVFIIFCAIPFLFLVKEPDLGTALILFAIFFLVSLTKGFEKSFITGLVIFSLLACIVFGKVIWSGLKGYQKNRIVAFIDPGVDPSGIGYQIEQSKITIGSGMMFGKGYLQGTQGPLRFLPEKHTDFIFSVYAEEWGFVGSAFLLFLYFLLLMRGFDTAIKTKDDFGRFVAMGISFMFLIFFSINMGVVLGIMPVVGVPLPFMSYGGSSLVSNFIAVGILINIRMRYTGVFYYR